MQDRNQSQQDRNQSQAEAQHPEGVKTPITVRLSEEHLKNLKHLARHLSYKLDADYNHVDIIRRLVDTIVAPPSNDHAERLQKDSIVNMFSADPHQRKYFYTGPVAVALCSCSQNGRCMCSGCPPFEDSPQGLLFKSMAKHERERVEKMSLEARAEWKSELVKDILEAKARRATEEGWSKLTWGEQRHEYLADILDSIESVESWRDLLLDPDQICSCGGCAPGLGCGSSTDEGQ